jgi:hypothetical protein
MKSNVMPSIVQIEANELKKLVAEVKETVATEIVNVNSKRKALQSFGLVDLWNIHRGMKRATASRRAF